MTFLSALVEEQPFQYLDRLAVAINKRNAETEYDLLAFEFLVEPFLLCVRYVFLNLTFYVVI